jgi:hypothetical protein
MNKLMINGVGPTVFEVIPDIYKGMLENVKRFIIRQIINEEIFNVNIIYYFFKFL